MKKNFYYIVDVFAANRYEGNQLAVFIDLDNQLAEGQMQQIAKEINFAESTFIKARLADQEFWVRIFTPEHEVPFAGHPSIGTSYIIAKFLLPNVPEKLTLNLAHSPIEISILQPEAIDESILFMRQAQPEFRDYFTHDEIANELGIPIDQLDTSMPVQEISTGLPYIIIPLNKLDAMNRLALQYETFRYFLLKRKKYRTNSSTGHSTSLFFVTNETVEAGNQYNARMLLLENGQLSEDAATGSANGCFLAYLLKHGQPACTASVEQGYQMGRKSIIYLDGYRQGDHYEINVGGRTQLVAEGYWYV